MAKILTDWVMSSTEQDRLSERVKHVSETMDRVRECIKTVQQLGGDDAIIDYVDTIDWNALYFEVIRDPATSIPVLLYLADKADPEVSRRAKEELSKRDVLGWALGE